MVAAGIKIGPPDQLLIYMQKRAGGNCPKTIPACSFLRFLYIMIPRSQVQKSDASLLEGSFLNLGPAKNMSK